MSKLKTKVAHFDKETGKSVYIYKYKQIYLSPYQNVLL